MRLQQRMSALGMSYRQLADAVHDHGWPCATKTQVWRMLNRKHGYTQQELAATARALGTTHYWAVTGHGQEGEPVVIFGAAARAEARAKPGRKPVPSRARLRDPLS
jgi:transcriptional regulator with XRE-family HTH domain